MRTSSTVSPRARPRGPILAAALAVAVVLVSLVGAGTATAATASAGGGTICVPVRLTGTGSVVSQTATATSTIADIFLAGRKIATTSATFVTNPDGTFSGPVVFTPVRLRGGTLVAQISGAFGAGPSFSADGPVRGTGVLSRASGQLHFEGPLRADGTFDEVITGKLCVDLRSW